MFQCDIVAIVLFVAYLAFSYLVTALVASTGFAYGALVIAKKLKMN